MNSICSRGNSYTRTLGNRTCTYCYLLRLCPHSSFSVCLRCGAKLVVCDQDSTSSKTRLPVALLQTFQRSIRISDSHLLLFSIRAIISHATCCCCPPPGRHLKDYPVLQAASLSTSTCSPSMSCDHPGERHCCCMWHAPAPSWAACCLARIELVRVASRQAGLPCLEHYSCCCYHTAVVLLSLDGRDAGTHTHMS